MFILRFTAALVVFTAVQAFALEAEVSKEDAAFFNGKVLPLFKQRCYECHSHEAGKIKAGLSMDTRDGLLKGGDSGPAIVPKNLEKSMLITAIRFHDEDLQMPPKKKMEDAEIATLEEWIKRGAPDPRQTAPGLAGTDEIWKKAKTHWAFQPVGKPAPPTVKSGAWVRTPIDAFVLQKLEAAGLKPSAPVDKPTLIRRATYDLVGVPPTPAEVAAFVADATPNAYEKLLDRLLASPHYGERWGRYWLDVARYSDTTGDPALFGRENRYLDAWTYRDYVVRAFNQDKPFDRFVLEQLAADRLPDLDEKASLAALGFVTVGKKFAQIVDDRIDDRIDVVTRGLLGLTVACARCHDHKFDPLSQLDYYSLHGIFMSSQEPELGPAISTVADPEQAADFERQMKSAQGELDEYEAQAWNSTLSAHWRRLGDFLMVAHDNPFKPGSGKSPTTPFRLAGLSGRIGNLLYQYVNSTAGSPVFFPWKQFEALKSESFQQEAPELARKLAGQLFKTHPLHPLVAKMFEGEAPKSLKEVADRYAKLFTEIDQAYQQKREEAVRQTGKQAAEVPALEGEAEALRKVLYGPDSFAPIDKLTFIAENGNKSEVQRAKFVTKINNLRASHPGAPARAMVLEDKPKAIDSFVYLRGDKLKKGPVAPRQFIKVIAGENAPRFTDGSGRLELARAIVSESNPLTARVLVNRVWLNHFGQGLVGTPSDFGLRGDAPTHPELLDFLARHFMENGWSVKKLHKLIMLSATYQQRSTEDARAAAKDPGNALLWRMNDRRLDFEAMRDTILALSNSLDGTLGGRPIDIATDAKRRTIYATVDRLNLPGLFTTFDFALPDISSPRRYETTVPTQALFLMNSPFVIEQAKKIAGRGAITAAAADEQKVRALYRLVFQRAPDVAELKSGLAYLAQQQSRAEEPKAAPPAWKYGTGGFNPAQNKASFAESARFKADRWLGPQAEKSVPPVVLTAVGGSGGPKLSAIRRWVAPIAATVRIDGRLSLPEKAGSLGVLARIVHTSGAKVSTDLAHWPLPRGEVATRVAEVKVEAGDTIDFMVKSLDPTNTEFAWAPIVERADMTTPEESEQKHQWTAEAEFTGPAPAPLKGMTPVEKYTQVLLLTNELLYVR